MEGFPSLLRGAWDIGRLLQVLPLDLISIETVGGGMPIPCLLSLPMLRETVEASPAWRDKAPHAPLQWSSLTPSLEKCIFFYLCKQVSVQERDVGIPVSPGKNELPVSLLSSPFFE